MENNPKNKYPVIFLVYRDSVVWNNQEKIEDKFPVFIMHTTGFLVRETEDSYLIAREVVSNQNDDLRGALTIPKEAVIYFETIKKAQG